MNENNKNQFNENKQKCKLMLENIMKRVEFHETKKTNKTKNETNETNEVNKLNESEINEINENENPFSLCNILLQDPFFLS